MVRQVKWRGLPSSSAKDISLTALMRSRIVLPGAMSMAPRTRILRYGVGFFMRFSVQWLLGRARSQAVFSPRNREPGSDGGKATPTPALGWSALSGCRRSELPGPWAVGAATRRRRAARGAKKGS